MLVVVSGISTIVSRSQPLNEDAPILVMPLPSVRVARLEQFIKAHSPILALELSKTTVFNAVQSLKAP